MDTSLHDTVKGIPCETRLELSPSWRPWLYDQHREQKELVYLHFWMSETPSHCVCVFAVQTIESFFMCTNDLEYNN